MLNPPFQFKEEKIYCPYCGEKYKVLVHYNEEEEHYIEDCYVCCRPIHFSAKINIDGEVELRMRAEHE